MQEYTLLSSPKDIEMLTVYDLAVQGIYMYFGYSCRHVISNVYHHHNVVPSIVPI